MLYPGQDSTKVDESFPETTEDGQLVLYRVVGNEFAGDRAFIQNQLKKLYNQLLHQLESNHRFQAWLEKNSGDLDACEIGLEAQEPDDRRLSASFTGLQVSAGFLEFKRCMHVMYDLMRHRLLRTYEESIKAHKLSREFWIREQVHKKEAVRLQSMLEKMQSKWDKNRCAYDAEIAGLQKIWDQMVESGFQQCRNIV